MRHRVVAILEDQQTGFFLDGVYLALELLYYDLQYLLQVGLVDDECGDELQTRELQAVFHAYVASFLHVDKLLGVAVQQLFVLSFQFDRFEQYFNQNVEQF